MKYSIKPIHILASGLATLVLGTVVAPGAANAATLTDNDRVCATEWLSGVRYVAVVDSEETLRCNQFFRIPSGAYHSGGIQNYSIYLGTVAEYGDSLPEEIDTAATETANCVTKDNSYNTGGWSIHNNNAGTCSDSES